MSALNRPQRKEAVRWLAMGPVNRGIAPNLVRKWQRHRLNKRLRKEIFSYIQFQSQRNHRCPHKMNRIRNQNIEMTSSNPITTNQMI